MRKFILLLLVLWATSDRAHAAEKLGMTVATQTRAWEAVGRLNLIGTGFCTAALIAPNLVLTAAHCMFDKRTGKRVALENIEFLAGFRDGRAAAKRSARRVLINKDYRYGNKRRLERVATDIALIELKRPIKNARIIPFGRAKRPKIGETVEVVSYATDHPNAPTLQETCRVLGRDPSVLVLSCQVNFGASGSPIFVIENGVARITSVVSAKAEWNRKKVALGAGLGRPLQDLIGQMSSLSQGITDIQSLASQ